MKHSLKGLVVQAHWSTCLLDAFAYNRLSARGKGCARFGELGARMGHRLINEIVEGMTEKIREFGENFDYIVCLGIGDRWATPLATKLKVDIIRIPERKTELPREKGVRLTTLIYKKNLYFRDFKAGDEVIIIDDVISTGKTMETIIDTLNKMGVEVRAVFCIVAKGSD